MALNIFIYFSFVFNLHAIYSCVEVDFTVTLYDTDRCWELVRYFLLFCSNVIRTRHDDTNEIYYSKMHSIVSYTRSAFAVAASVEGDVYFLFL